MLINKFKLHLSWIIVLALGSCASFLYSSYYFIVCWLDFGELMKVIFNMVFNNMLRNLFQRHQVGLLSSRDWLDLNNSLKIRDWLDLSNSPNIRDWLELNNSLKSREWLDLIIAWKAGVALILIIMIWKSGIGLTLVLGAIQKVCHRPRGEGGQAK